jgi:transglutaminase-like putative cysteine protease
MILALSIHAARASEIIVPDPVCAYPPCPMTGYLGDIGVPASDSPMDFSGWFEAFLGGRWYTFDARHNTPRIGRVLLARGRDASDVAISTTFGPSFLKSFKVWTDEIVGRRVPLLDGDLRERASESHIAT